MTDTTRPTVEALIARLSLHGSIAVAEAAEVLGALLTERDTWQTRAQSRVDLAADLDVAEQKIAAAMAEPGKASDSDDAGIVLDRVLAILSAGADLTRGTIVP